MFLNTSLTVFIRNIFDQQHAIIIISVCDYVQDCRYCLLLWVSAGHGLGSRGPALALAFMHLSYLSLW